ncbi:MAG: 30S ribosome-binding factor RbfA [Rickettsiales bacterium]|nr:30S ribosome-binding factor RbfA [Rickettsiales bacterium]
MKSQRQLQVGEQIKRVIAEIFLREGLLTMMGSCITILEADTSPDIKNVRVYIDIFGDAKNNKAILQRLNKAAPYFRYELGKRLSSRNIPEILFILDRTEENALHLEALLEKESEAIMNPKKSISPLAKKPRKKK